MACVAIFTVWAWQCPVCRSVVKDWKEDGADYHAAVHADTCLIHYPIEDRAERRALVKSTQTTWVFNVVSDIAGNHQALVDSLDKDTGTRVST